VSRRPHFLSRLLEDPRGCALINHRTGDVVAGHLETGFDSATRRTGLLGRDSLDRHTAFILAPCSAVHTIGMRFSIAVIFVRRDGTVARVVGHLRPWRIAVSLGAFSAVELAARSPRDLEVQPGDRLIVCDRP